eukprot:PhM_4_TR14370/c0_g1_i1/m.98118
MSLWRRPVDRRRRLIRHRRSSAHVLRVVRVQCPAELTVAQCVREGFAAVPRPRPHPLHRLAVHVRTVLRRREDIARHGGVDARREGALRYELSLLLDDGLRDLWLLPRVRAVPRGGVPATAGDGRGEGALSLKLFLQLGPNRLGATRVFVREPLQRGLVDLRGWGVQSTSSVAVVVVEKTSVRRELRSAGLALAQTLERHLGALHELEPDLTEVLYAKVRRRAPTGGAEPSVVDKVPCGLGARERIVVVVATATAVTMVGLFRQHVQALQRRLELRVAHLTVRVVTRKDLLEFLQPLVSDELLCAGCLA